MNRLSKQELVVEVGRLCTKKELIGILRQRSNVKGGGFFQVATDTINKSLDVPSRLDRIADHYQNASQLSDTRLFTETQDLNQLVKEHDQKMKEYEQNKQFLDANAQIQKLSDLVSQSNQVITKSGNILANIGGFMLSPIAGLKKEATQAGAEMLHLASAYAQLKRF